MGRLNLIGWILGLLVALNGSALAGGIGPSGGRGGGTTVNTPPAFAVFQNSSCAAQALSCAVTLGAVTAGNTLIAGIADGQNLTVNAFVVSDSSGAVWLPIITSTNDDVENHSLNHMHMWYSRNHPPGVTTVTATHTASANFVDMTVVEVGGLGPYPTPDALGAVNYANSATIQTSTIAPLTAGVNTGAEFIFGVGTFEGFVPTVSVSNLQDYGSGDGQPNGLSNAQTSAAGGGGIIGAWQMITDPTKNYGFSWTNPGAQMSGAIVAFKIAPSFNNDITFQNLLVGGATTLTPPAVGNLNAIATWTATATLSLGPPQWAGQFMSLDVCPATFTATVAAASGVTIRGSSNIPAFTANLCTPLGFKYYAPNTWELSGVMTAE